MSLHRPNWDDMYDRDLYDKLWQKGPKNWSDEEREFVITMYHMEEYACGLDGDR